MLAAAGRVITFLYEGTRRSTARSQTLSSGLNYRSAVAIWFQAVEEALHANPLVVAVEEERLGGDVVQCG